MDETTSGLEADMDDAPHNHPGTGHDSSATMIAPDTDAAPDDAAAESAPDEKPTSSGSLQSSLQTLRRGQSARFARMAVIAVTLAALALLLPSLIASTARRPAAQVAPTQAPPTATASPAPTLISGFQFVSDAEDGFTFQVPQNWTCAETNPGIECRDDADAPNYKAQVQLPGDWTVPGGQPNGDDASPWVNYALNAFSETPGQVFERAPGPTSTITINGVRWQTSGGLISVDTSSGADNGSGGTPTATPPIQIRVQVYATIHNDKPYLIALYSTDDQFAAATKNYFGPMLGSFQFTPVKV
ncbi:MAG TPA: hypothetical protein VH349_14600 [Ktedonobacterales bacterium]|jgi:hypothetical protein